MSMCLSETKSDVSDDSGLRVHRLHETGITASRSMITRDEDVRMSAAIDKPVSGHGYTSSVITGLESLGDTTIHSTCDGQMPMPSSKYKPVSKPTTSHAFSPTRVSIPIPTATQIPTTTSTTAMFFSTSTSTPTTAPSVTMPTTTAASIPMHTTTPTTAHTKGDIRGNTASIPELYTPTLSQMESSSPTESARKSKSPETCSNESHAASSVSTPGGMSDTTYSGPSGPKSSLSIPTTISRPMLQSLEGNFEILEMHEIPSIKSVKTHEDNIHNQCAKSDAKDKKGRASTKSVQPMPDNVQPPSESMQGADMNLGCIIMDVGAKSSANANICTSDESVHSHSSLHSDSTASTESVSASSTVASRTRSGLKNLQSTATRSATGNISSTLSERCVPEMDDNMYLTVSNKVADEESLLCMQRGPTLDRYELKVLGIPPRGIRTRVETQINLCLELVSPATSTNYDRLHINQALVSKNSQKVAHLTHNSLTSSGRSLWLSAEVVSETHPQRKIEVCDACQRRERKRLQRAKSRHGMKDNGDAPYKRLLVFNTKATVDFSTGNVILPTRITCYCRHHDENIGFRVFLSLSEKDGAVVASTLTNVIMVTDDHKSVKRRRNAKPRRSSEDIQTQRHVMSPRSIKQRLVNADLQEQSDGGCSTEANVLEHTGNTHKRKKLDKGVDVGHIITPTHTVHGHTHNDNAQTDTLSTEPNDDQITSFDASVHETVGDRCELWQTSTDLVGAGAPHTVMNGHLRTSPRSNENKDASMSISEGTMGVNDPHTHNQAHSQTTVNTSVKTNLNLNTRNIGNEYLRFDRIIPDHGGPGVPIAIVGAHLDQNIAYVGFGHYMVKGQMINRNTIMCAAPFHPPGSLVLVELFDQKGLNKTGGIPLLFRYTGQQQHIAMVDQSQSL